MMPERSPTRTSPHSSYTQSTTASVHERPRTAEDDSINTASHIALMETQECDGPCKKLYNYKDLKVYSCGHVLCATCWGEMRIKDENLDKCVLGNCAKSLPKPECRQSVTECTQQVNDIIATVIATRNSSTSSVHNNTTNDQEEVPITGAVEKDHQKPELPIVRSISLVFAPNEASQYFMDKVMEEQADSLENATTIESTLGSTTESSTGTDSNETITSLMTTTTTVDTTTGGSSPALTGTSTLPSSSASSTGPSTTTTNVSERLP